VLLTWSTTNAAAANISGIGPVALSGTMTVTPTTSMNYTLQAIAEDGAAVLATATVLVGNTPAPPVPAPVTTPGGEAQQLQADIKADVTAVKGALVTVAAQARAEYDSLNPALQARLHQIFNDVEQAGGLALSAIHTLFGAKPPTTGSTS
jgi:hypothetical protein